MGLQLLVLSAGAGRAPAADRMRPPSCFLPFPYLVRVEAGVLRASSTERELSGLQRRAVDVLLGAGSYSRDDGADTARRA